MLAKHKVGSSTLLTRSIFKPLRNQGLFFADQRLNVFQLVNRSSFTYVSLFDDYLHEIDIGRAVSDNFRSRGNWETVVLYR